MKERRVIWEVTSLQKIVETVVFDHEVTADEAYRLYSEDLYEDIVNEQRLQVRTILAVG